MRNTSRLSVRGLLLTAAFAFALGAPFAAPAAAQKQGPPEKPPQMEERPGEPAPEVPPVPESEEEKPAKPAPGEEEAAPEKKPAKPAPKEEEAAPEEKPAEPAPKEEEAAPAAKPAQKAPPAEEEEEAISPKQAAINAAVEMSERLAKLGSFSIKGTLAWEQVLDNGEKILALEQVRAHVKRPHHLRMERLSPARDRVLFYDGEQVVLWGPTTRYYAAAPFTGTLAELVTHLADSYGYETPLADLFMWGHEKKQIEAIEEANWIGQDLLDGRICDHYAYRQEGVDWQLWIDTERGGLPCGYAIIDLSDPARPLYLAKIVIDPDAEFDDKRFTFDPPKDSARIPLATTQPPKEKAEPEEEEGVAPDEKAVPQPEEKGAPNGEAAPNGDKAPEVDEAPKKRPGEDMQEMMRKMMEKCPCKRRQDPR